MLWWNSIVGYRNNTSARRLIYSIMGVFSSHRVAGAVLVAAAAVFFRQVLVHHVAGLAGHMNINKAGTLQRWADSPLFNNGACVVEYAANACEDVVVHFASSTVFAACGDPHGRAQWYPPAGQRNARGRAEASFREQLFKHDVKTGKTTELRVEGLKGDFVTHGIDLWSSPTDRSKVRTSLQITRRYDRLTI